jgi:hypothetical protein
LAGYFARLVDLAALAIIRNIVESDITIAWWERLFNRKYGRSFGTCHARDSLTLRTVAEVAYPAMADSGASVHGCR